MTPDRPQSGPYLLFMLALSLFALFILGADAMLKLDPRTHAIIEHLDLGICLLFFADFLVSLARAESKSGYFFRWGWLYLLSSIPMVDALRWGRLARVLRIIRVLRGLRSAKVLVDSVLARKAESGALAAGLLTLLLTVFAAIAILQLENARALADQIGDTRRQYEVFRLLSLAYEQKGFLRQALDSYKRFHRLGEEVRQQELAQEQAAIRDNYIHVERVQHIKELEQQLSQSEHQQERYLWSSITTSLLLALFIYLFFTLWLKLRTARLQAKRTGEALLIEPRSGLANWQRLMNRWPREMAKRQLKSERWYLSEEPTSEFDDKLHYLLFRVPFLLNVREQHGYQASSEIEQAFGAYIETLTPQDGRIYDLREGHLLYVVPQRHVANLHQLAGDLLIAIAAFPCDYPIDRRVSLGIVSHPFLPKAATALDHHGLFDLCYLALSGAIQLSEKHQQNVWLELAAIDCQQAAFFNGDVWQCALMAIDKGLVKVNSSHEKQWVNWHQLARKQDTGPQP